MVLGGSREPFNGNNGEKGGSRKPLTGITEERGSREPHNRDKHLKEALGSLITRDNLLREALGSLLTRVYVSPCVYHGGYVACT